MVEDRQRMPVSRAGRGVGKRKTQLDGRLSEVVRIEER